jgi:hypothetical protein
MHDSENIPLYQARMGGSTGCSLSRCFEDPRVGRWDCISAKGTGKMDEEERRVRRVAATIIYSPDARFPGSHDGPAVEDLSARREASKRN